MDAIGEGRSLGVPQTTTMDFAQTPEGTKSAYSAISMNVRSARAGGAVCFTADQRKKSVS